MPTFSATYTTSAGQTRTLRVQASDLSAARRSLRQRGIVPSSLQQVAASAAPEAAKGGSSLFSADLGRLLEARPGVREKALADLVINGDISSKEAMAKASKPEELGRLLQGQGS